MTSHEDCEVGNVCFGDDGPTSDSRKRDDSPQVPSFGTKLRPFLEMIGVPEPLSRNRRQDSERPELDIHISVQDGSARVGA
ncbi:hypothetical protein GLOTRDRAFT_106329 [Gloeophyllum trabeum ATCC 11539]|uniref:Uncharacterized protein n=1 Tax=Gloeophyllum trabeum (strain ATCC 11539 / FP-39264 / Madison 617) TaxID=670483 RepID=S7Q650_GLOTA|nr:uncharacterized protein GLOTRDRAFT_106329 [Gloeophyllum trabeum ATCC 11539]EPQ54948.1 hypothetical protein GLOTRDRAFT_106329 [Gloeophyllum trabeum ATCC 11539]